MEPELPVKESRLNAITYSFASRLVTVLGAGCAGGSARLHCASPKPMYVMTVPPSWMTVLTSGSSSSYT